MTVVVTVLSSLLVLMFAFLLRQTSVDRKDTNARLDKLEAAIGTSAEDLTKEISGVRTDLTKEISGVRTDLTKEISGVRTDLTKEISGVRTDLTAYVDNRSDQVESKLTAEVTSLRGEIGNLRTDMTNMLNEARKELAGSIDKQRDKHFDAVIELKGEIAELRREVEKQRTAATIAGQALQGS